ncbi:hypothetical protein [Leifsonia aquatica]|uniref:hypothetical protein n=1 Tax=Leifsonia aquatica TaxID=144185 RepID=UPI0028B07324|nr:hypothetical protein [Leifsonia aquatica]
MLGDVGRSILLGGAGWVVVCIVPAASLSAGQALWGDALAFFVIGGMWPAGFLSAIVTVFLVWMPAAAFVAAVGARRRGQRVRRSWSVMAWCLVGLDLLILLMVAEAVFVPTGEGHEPWAIWQTALFVVTSSILVLVSFCFAAVWIGTVLPSRWRSARRATRGKRSPDEA